MKYFVHICKKMIHDNYTSTKYNHLFCVNYIPASSLCWFLLARLIPAGSL